MEANAIYLAWCVGLVLVGLVGVQAIGRAYRGAAAFMNLDESSWWRTTLPWPSGVQEDDEVHFHVDPAPSPLSSLRPVATATLEDVASGVVAVPVVRLARRTRIR